MRRWFLSYNSQDLRLMQRLEASLRHKDAEAHIYFAPKSMRAGGYWLPELATEIAEATAFVLLVGEKGIGDWQVTEYYEAYSKRVKAPDFPVVLVLLKGQPGPGLPFLRQLHWIVTSDPASEQTIAQLMDAAAGGGKRPSELWRFTAPYRGLSAMEEKDSDYFFGRGRETVEVIRALEAAPDKLPIILGNSGVGKSSLAQAGVLAAVGRQAWPETVGDADARPQVFDDSRRWSVLKIRPGAEPVRALVERFLRTWQIEATDPLWARRLAEWSKGLKDDSFALRDLLDATERRYDELHQPKPPMFFLYVDQGEELYVRAEEFERRRFSAVLAQGLADPRLRALMSMRADFLGELQRDESLYKVHCKVDVPPLREAELREVVSRPADVLSARFETDGLASYIAGRTAEESTKDAGALPLLSYLLDDMWTQMVHRGDGVLRLPAGAVELGGVLVKRANDFLVRYPSSEDQLRRILTLKLATVREDGEPTRRLALRSEFSDEEWRLVSELADHPNRLLVTATPGSGETYAEIAHEAIFRRWDKLRDWIAAERDFLSWKGGLETARRAWQAAPANSKEDALLMGLALAQAHSWLTKRGEDLPKAERKFIDDSLNREASLHRRTKRARAFIYVLLVGMITGLVGWINQTYVKEQWNWFMTARPYMLANVRPYVLTAEAERALKPLASFRECARDCPEMVVIPAGEFTMGSPATERGRYENEGPQHSVTIARPFAASKFDVTFAEWDACVSVGGCPQANNAGYGRDTNPVINVNWDEAQQYVTWLSKMTGQPYRLLTEAEWEYAARAGTTTAFFWGERVGIGNANCRGCGGIKSVGLGTSPVGSFKANAFGLYDMAGNVFQWVQDCYNGNYNAAPTDGSAWTNGDCSRRVVRGGAWSSGALLLRSASRIRYATFGRSNFRGLRVGRTLSVP